jgi:MoaA/NifB/PqqE/SkfB family radical SAM enzyme
MKVYPNIPVRFTTFPDNYINDINGWAFDKTTIAENIGKLLTLDLDFGSYCSLNCPTCFRYNNSIDNIKYELDFDKLVAIVKEAKTLGLKSVKFLGAGDPFENKGFLDFLRFLNAENIIPLIFTKGQVLGDDNLVFKYFSSYGILTGEELVKELFELNCSIMLSINSFDDVVQGKMVGRPKEYIYVRNRALELLVDAGFNQPIPTRLAIINSPVTKWNYDDAFEIYKWGRLRNFYTVITPTMISGRAKRDRTWQAVNPTEEQLKDLYVQVYRFNIETNLQTLEQIKSEGIATYAGAHPCNQVSTGLYVSLNGVVLSCPGSELNIEGNVWEKSITEIWQESQNLKRAGTFNNGCIAKEGKSIPDGFFNKVLKTLLYEE